LDYANATVRLPDLKEHLDEDTVPDAAEAQELEELTRGVPKLMGILPDVLRDRGDARHNVALAGMVSDLTAALDQVNPQLVVSRTREKHHQGPDAEQVFFCFAATITTPHRGCSRGHTVKAHSCLSHGQIPGQHRSFMRVYFILLRIS
jgi:hypothetical protein